MNESTSTKSHSTTTTETAAAVTSTSASSAAAATTSASQEAPRLDFHWNRLHEHHRQQSSTLQQQQQPHQLQKQQQHQQDQHHDESTEYDLTLAEFAPPNQQQQLQDQQSSSVATLTSTTTTTRNWLDIPPSRVLDFLHLGNCTDAQDKNFLESANISVIVNMSTQEYWCPSKSIKVHSFTVCDDPNAAIDSFFPQVFEVLDQCRLLYFAALANGDKRPPCALIHCQKGVSRSPTCVIAYLVTKNGMAVAEALEHLARCRPIVEPNVGFMTVLRTHQDQLDRTERNAAKMLLNITLSNVADNFTEQDVRKFYGEVGMVWQVKGFRRDLVVARQQAKLPKENKEDEGDDVDGEDDDDDDDDNHDIYSPTRAQSAADLTTQTTGTSSEATSRNDSIHIIEGTTTGQGTTTTTTRSSSAIIVGTGSATTTGSDTGGDNDDACRTPSPAAATATTTNKEDGADEGEEREGSSFSPAGAAASPSSASTKRKKTRKTRSSPSSGGGVALFSVFFLLSETAKIARLRDKRLAQHPLTNGTTTIRFAKSAASKGKGPKQ